MTLLQRSPNAALTRAFIVTLLKAYHTPPPELFQVELI